MSRASRTRRRRVAASALAVLTVGAGAALLTPAARESVAQDAAGEIRYEGWITAHNGRLLGGAAQGAPGEVWAATRPVPGDPSRSFLMRYTRDAGWHQAEGAVDEQGQPYAGGTLLEARVTARGGLLLVADDGERPEGQRRVVMVREAAGPPRVVPGPPDGMLLPGGASIPAEVLSPRAIAARDVAGATEAFLSIAGPPAETGIARWGDGAWSREPICVADSVGTPPADCRADETLVGSASSLSVVALAAAEGGSAWALARANPATRRGLVLFERVAGEGRPRWRLRELAEPLFESDATPARAVAAVAPLDGGNAITATGAGVWLDATFTFRNEARDATLHFDGTQTTTWCDPVDAGGALCDHPLGIDLAADEQSFAWAGEGFGARIVGTVTAATGNRAHYATLEGDRFVPRASFAGSGAAMAFSAPDEGWVDFVHVTRDAWSSPLASWSVPLRRPVVAIAGEPGRTPGDLGAGALAVGMRGSIMRYSPEQGWDSEALLAAGGVATPNLRGVAWPAPDVAYAVGDEGAMWRWRRVTGLWEPDPAAPFDFVGHLTGVAFQPGVPERGYAVGRAGVLLRYGKSWEPDPLPPEALTAGPFGGPVDVYSVAFAGSQALAAAGQLLLVNDGGGWQVDAGAREAMQRAGGRSILAVAGLPDGGAVAAGEGVVLVRDNASAPWRATARAPLGTVVAVAAFREDGVVRALAALAGGWPLPQELTPPLIDPAAPPPRLPAFSTPADGYLIRETAGGWRDEQRVLLGAPGPDGARKADPILALLTDASGRGWAVGGWNSASDLSGRGVDSGRDPLLPRMETSAVNHYDPAGPQASANVRAVPVATPAGPARFLVGGGARCSATCAELGPIAIGPDRTLARALEIAGRLHGQPQGPRALLYTGGRTPAGTAAAQAPAEQARFAQLLGTATLPVLPAVADGEAAGGSSLSYEQAFRAFPAPLGEGPAPAGMTAVDAGAAPAAAGRARTHYAVDTAGPDGTVRIVVIDNAAGSLAARDMTGNPMQDQKTWLVAVLADARQRGLPVVVVGNRPLNPRADRAAADADEVAAILRDGGASAYLYEGAQEHRRGTIPAGTGGVPAFATGTLGYRAATGPVGYGVTGLLLLEVDVAGRDPVTGRSPVAVRLVPVMEDLAAEAVDGRVLNRSQPALFRALGRRPRSGDLEDQYLALPNEPCTGATRCPDRIDPEVRFSSSDPDIADFVQVDRSSPNPRKPLLDPATDKVIPDAGSGLLCAFNAGTTTITVEAGGMAYSTVVTVRDGSVLRPCGTMPLNPERFPRVPPSSGELPVAPPPPAEEPREDPPTSLSPPPPPPQRQPVVQPDPLQPAPAPEPRPDPPPPPRPEPRPEAPEPTPVPQAPALPGLVPLSPPPPPPSVARPIPPSGTAPVSVNVTVASPVAQVQREREEEEALEQSQAYARVSADHEPGRVAAPLLALVLLAALSGATVRRARRDQRPRYALARDPERRPPAGPRSPLDPHDRDQHRRFTR